MNLSVTTAPISDETSTTDATSKRAVSVIPAAPVLAEITAAICADAQQDSLKYVLRSNTWHDGE